MEELTICLNYNADDFRELYYAEGKSSMLRHAPARSSILSTLLVLVLNVSLYFISLKYPSLSWLLALGMTALIFVAGYSMLQIIKFIKRKRRIESYLKDLSRHKFYELRLTDKAIIVTIDEDITIEKWETMKSAKLNEKYVQLDNENGTAYILPAKSMTIKEFVQLKDFVLLKVK